MATSESGTDEPSPASTTQGTAPLSKWKAGALIVLTPAALGAGLVVYASGAPARSGGVDIVDVELGHRPWPSPEWVVSSLKWDLILILGYGIALACGLTLAKAVFGRAALAEWPTLEPARKKRRDAGKRRMAWLIGGAAVLVVVADLLENGGLWLATRASSEPALLRHGITALAVVKFCALVPSGLIAVLGWLVAIRRLWADPPPQIDASDAVPIEPHASQTASTRWRRGYTVPGLTRTVVAARAGRGSTVGFCLSGGGVRSASVALGAMQAMRNELRNARYLASVSGGGYTAGALQLALTAAPSPEAKPTDTPVRDPATALMPGTVEEDHVRRHASYIADGAGQLAVALGVVARGLVLSLFVLFGPAIVLGYLVGRAYTAVPLAKWTARSLLPWNDKLEYPDVRTGTLVALGVIAGLALLVFFLALFVESQQARLQQALRGVGSAFTLLGLLVAALAVGVPSLVFAAAWIAGHGHVGLTAGGTLGSLLLSYVATVAAIGRRRLTSEKKKQDAKDSPGLVAKASKAIPAGAFKSALVALTLLVLAAAWLILLGGVASVASKPDAGWTVLAVTVLLTLVVALVDIPAMSLHPFYRRRIASAFAVRRVISDGQPVPMAYEFGERTTLSTYAERVEEPSAFPEVIFAAAANLTGEQRAPLSAVGFTFTGDWVGGPDVGYIRTSTLEKHSRPQLAADLTVEAAVALSGAAFASAMGRMSSWYGTLLAVTGARLGSWLPNPAFVRGASKDAANNDWTVPRLPRIRRLPYLVREVFGMHRCDGRLLQITDGGHYENLGLVELLRRRCDLIYCIDASGDTPPTAATLRQAFSLASAELGVTFQGTDALWDLVPGSGAALKPTEPLDALNDKLASTCTLRLTFEYPEESDLPEGERFGTLIIAKAVLTSNMSYGLLARGASDPLFPRDPTSDQFFDDDKYCSYTALGRTLGRAALAKRNEVALQVPGQAPSSVRQLVDD